MLKIAKVCVQSLQIWLSKPSSWSPRMVEIGLYHSSLISCEFAAYMNPIHSSWLLNCWKWDTFPGFPILSTAEQMLIRYSPLSHKESSFLWRLSMANLSLNVNIFRWMHLQINRSIEIDSEKISWYWNSSGKLGDKTHNYYSFLSNIWRNSSTSIANC